MNAGMYSGLPSSIALRASFSPPLGWASEAMALTRMFRLPSSRARVPVMLATAVFMAA